MALHRCWRFRLYSERLVAGKLYLEKPCELWIATGVGNFGRLSFPNARVILLPLYVGRMVMTTAITQTIFAEVRFLAQVGDCFSREKNSEAGGISQTRRPQGPPTYPPNGILSGIGFFCISEISAPAKASHPRATATIFTVLRSIPRTIRTSYRTISPPSNRTDYACVQPFLLVLFVCEGYKSASVSFPILNHLEVEYTAIVITSTAVSLVRKSRLQQISMKLLVLLLSATGNDDTPITSYLFRLL